MQTRARWIALGGILFAGCAGATEDHDTGKTRPVWHDGFPHRQVIKFTDDSQARLGGDGKLDLDNGGDGDAITALIAEHGLELRPMLRLGDAKLDTLSEYSSEASDLRGMYAAQPSTDRDGQLAAANALLALPEVEYVYLEPLGVPPPGDLAPTTELYVAQQTYRGTAGIDAEFAATVGATGAGVRLLDVEYGWTYGHEDLVDRDLHPEPGQTIDPQTISWGWDQHGTAVVGETSAVDNAYGMTGLVPDADVYTFPELSVEGGWRRTEAIAAAIAAARPGDVVLLEMQTVGAGGQYAPAEYDPAVWQIVKTATDAGIVVVAAAGNGNENLDSPGYAEYRARGDSGAIIVGAASPERQKMSFSTYGARVDLHGWGERVATLGYGDLVRHGTDMNQAYTAQFSGTSSASPIVASACVAIQSYALQTLGRVLTPRELRDLLVETGTPQVDVGTAPIGPLPNLRAAIAKLDDEPEPPPPPPPGSIVINELLADPGGFDASGDGVYSATADEFIELVNVGGLPVDLSGATIADRVGVRVTIPAGTIVPAGGVLVVFGGGAAVLPAGVQAVSIGTLALNNDGDTITIAQGTTTLATMTYGTEGGRDQSLVRNPERDAAAPFVQHRTVAATPASPGTRADGTAL